MKTIKEILKENEIIKAQNEILKESIKDYMSTIVLLNQRIYSLQSLNFELNKIKKNNKNRRKNNDNNSKKM